MSKLKQETVEPQVVAETPRQLAYVALRERGMSIKDAALKAGYSEGALSYVYRNVEPRRQQGLLAPLANQARKTVKRIVKGLPAAPGSPAPRAADSLRAAELILERVDPVVHRVQSQSVNTSVVLTPEERARFAASLGLPPPPDPQAARPSGLEEQ